MLSVDLHTHSIASGHGTTDRVTDMAKEAFSRGLSLLGLGEHAPGPPGGACRSYFTGLKLLPRSYKTLSLRYGAEVNILDKDGRLDLPDEVLKGLDYVIASIHPGTKVPGNKESVLLAYTKAMKNPFVTFIGHPDDSRFPVDYNAFVSGCLKYGCIPELNEVSVSPSSYRQNSLNCARELLKHCMLYSCPVLVSSDSHGAKGVGAAPNAEKLLKELSFPEKLIINNRLDS